MEIFENVTSTWFMTSLRVPDEDGKVLSSKLQKLSQVELFDFDCDESKPRDLTSVRLSPAHLLKEADI